MKIIHRAGERIDLRDYGIQVPAGRDNAERTIRHLLELSSSPAPPQWWIRDPGPPVLREDLERVHTPRYVNALFSGGEALEREIVRAFELVLPDGRYNRYDPAGAALPLADLFARLLERGGGTLRAGEEALEYGSAMFLGGGFHHAMPDFGAGFCVFHDIMTAVRRLRARDRIRTAWIVDVDAHKGDGTAVIAHGDPAVAALSIHMEHGWPLDLDPRQSNFADGRTGLSHTPSTIDIGIPEGAEDRYCAELDAGLHALWANRAGGAAGTGFVVDSEGVRRPVPHPDLVYVLLGADPFADDELPSASFLRMTRAQMLERNKLVHRFFLDRGIPAAYVMGGNYGESAWVVYADFLEWALGV